jgi:arabinose-5-phosphate isomerase
MDIKQRIAAVLTAEADAISRVNVDDQFERAVNVLLDCKGKVLTTGIGKAGHVARKFAATLCSTGTPSVFLHPAEAAHGDLGIVSRADVLIALSTSGKSREVLEILELARHLGVVHIIGITSHPDSSLREHCEVILDMGDTGEACPLGLTPTSSIAVMLAISDAVAIALMEAKGITRAEWGMRHHGGYLGRSARTDNVPH